MGSKEVKESLDAWSFKEAFLFSAGVVVTGFVVEIAGGSQGVALPSWPLNFIILLLLAANIVLAGLLLRKSPFVLWVGGIPVGLGLIAALALLSFFGGVLPQEAGKGALWTQKLRLNGVFSSWPFALTVFFFLVNLGLSLVWKLFPFKASNLQFILFHAGFWMALACGVMGAADLQRVIIPLYEGRSTAKAYSRSNAMIDLPFSLYLQDFEMQEYEPQLALFDPDNDRLEIDELLSNQSIAEGMVTVLGDLEVRVEKYFPFAMKDEKGDPVPVSADKGVSYVKISGTHVGKAFSGWVSTGSPFERPAFVTVENRLLVLVPGSPKKFRSQVTIRTGKDEDSRSVALEVNSPKSVMGWKLYQMGYDEKSGRWSSLSLVEGVKDPWLPAVYLGFFMIMAGNAIFFWKGIRKK
ncbi:MAG: cytochrome c biogenesis protein [Prosthecochloris sp.]|nr:cytochrome c biogenesis protein [Prosthecochloris sp.]